MSNEPLNPLPEDFFFGDADIEMRELSDAANEYAYAMRQVKALRRLGRLHEAAAACLHGAGYSVPSLAAERAGDPRATGGHVGFRCRDCGSFLDRSAFDARGADNCQVIAPCEFPREE